MEASVNLFRPSTDLEVRPAIAADVPHLALRLRHEDMAEIVAASGETPAVALGRGWLESEPCWTVLYKGEPSAMFGVCPTADVEWARFGRVWFLGSDKADLWSLSMHKFTTAWLRELCKGFDILGNVVDERQTVHLRWLKRVGFRQIRRYPQWGHHGLPFVELIITSEEIHNV